MVRKRSALSRHRFGLNGLTDAGREWPFPNTPIGTECMAMNGVLYWSDRVYFTEIMAQFSCGYARISLLSFTATPTGPA
jgi:hypothetical protein